MTPKVSISSRSLLLSMLLGVVVPSASAGLAAVVTARADDASPEARGRRIADSLFARGLGYGDMTASLEMTLRNGAGQETRREMRIRVLERPAREVGDYSLIVFDSPRDVRGTALLSHASIGEADEQWLYLPSVGRVRRVSSSNTTGPFVGSEFSYEDISGNEVDKHTWRFLRDVACPGGGTGCLEVETRPRYEGSGYSRRVLLVDGELRVRKVDFYDRRNALAKTLTYDDWQKHLGKYWRAHRWTMRNHQSGKSTVLVFRDVAFRTGLDESDFHRGALERAR